MDPELSASDSAVAVAVACALDRESAIILARDSAFTEFPSPCCKSSVIEAACAAALAFAFAFVVEVSPCAIASEIACTSACV